MITTNGSLPTVYAIPHLPQLVQGFWLPATTVGVILGGKRSVKGDIFGPNMKTKSHLDKGTQG